MSLSSGVLALLVVGAAAGGGGKNRGSVGLAPSSYVALTDFSSGGSPLLNNYASYSTGAYGGIGGGGIGGIGGIGGPTISAPYIGGGPISPPFGGVGAYNTGSYGAGAYNTGSYGAGAYGGIGGAQASRYAALAVQSSSSASTVGAYNTYANAAGVGGGKHHGPPAIGGLGLGGKHGAPRLGLGGGGKHGKHIAQAQPYEDVEVQQFVSNEGELVENQVNAYARKKQYTVTHRPVFHKTVYNHYTATDNINKDVYHHLYEDESRSFETAGEDFQAGALNVNHGNVGHAAYQSIVGTPAAGAYVGQGQGYASQVGDQGYASQGYETQGYASLAQPTLPRVGGVPSAPGFPVN